MDMAPVASSATVQERVDSNGTSEGNVKDAELQVHRFMEWWEGGHGEVAAKANPLLAAIDALLLSELISAGGGYHNILTLDRLDGLHRQFGGGTEPDLEPLRKALQTRGGAKNQARAVGMLLFNAARISFENSEGVAVVAPATSATPAVNAAASLSVTSQPAVSSNSAPAVADEKALDEVWSPPRRFVCSDAVPAGAAIAARDKPSKDGTLLTTFPEGTEFFSTGKKGDFIEIHYQDGGAQVTAYVPCRIGDMQILVAAQARPNPAPTTPGKSVAGAALVSAASSPPAKLGASSSPAPASPALVGPVESAGVAPQAVAAAPPFPVAATVPPLPSSRIEVLEARVAQQDRQLLALQCEVAELRSQLGAVASAFAPLIVARGGA